MFEDRVGLRVALVASLVCGAGAGVMADGVAPGGATFRVRIRARALAAAVRDALDGAARRVGRPECAAIFRDFNDASGRPLQDNLDLLGQSGPSYLVLLGFYDGEGADRCGRGQTLAITTPGSRAVWVCPRFALAQRRDPRLGEATLLHETLHSLGLGEHPPTPAEITSKVMERCSQ
jgi:hypothetical protein